MKPPYPLYIVVDEEGNSLHVDEKFHGPKFFDVEELGFGHDEKHIAERYAKIHNGKVATLYEWKETPISKP